MILEKETIDFFVLFDFYFLSNRINNSFEINELNSKKHNTQ